MTMVDIILSFLTMTVTVVIMPIILLKMNLQQKTNKRIGKERLDIEEAEMKITKFNRVLARETAQAVKEGKFNSTLNNAISDFDKAYKQLEEQKEKAFQRLKEEYK